MTDRHADELAVRAVLDRASAAWAAGDAAAYAAVFAPDADYVTFLGTHHKGRADIEACHMPLFERFQKGSRLDGEITQIRFLAPDVALVHGKGALVKGKQRRTARNTKVQIYVLVRRDGEWEISAFHNTRYHWLLAPLTTKFDARMAPSTLPPLEVHR
ncbi:SgcJ/EcaC family oxidoreductase [Nocardia blacklockiae]|uniref:SgcJ/EcaC family oxidoreductase n=1 Tax=Nocardia blacklockiae TaxID=480036 RepID=UPI0018934CF8|nr:SgcJ/EcaC family oxidoreductase [Nocardia blacklockiae]MBF6173304.1 SgcJ/EcaC family oxidoreductase [Nocardia blacklockiae]